MWKNRLWWIIGGLLLVGIGAFLLLGRREPLPPEEQIRQVLWRGKAGIEKEDPRQVMSVVSREYKDEAFQYYDVSRALLHAFREVDNITISLSQPAIQVAADGQTAKVHFDQVEIVASSQGQARHYPTPVDIELHRERRGWKVTRVTGWVDITE
jgi:hypothetical protein